MRARIVSIVFIVAACFVTSLPNIAGWTHQPTGGIYLGATPGSSADTASYYSQIEQARQGRWLFANQLTSEPQTPSLVQPIWLIGGWLARWLHLTTPVSFFLLRIIAVTAFVWLALRVFAAWGLSRAERLVVMIMLVTSSGLGWIWLRHTYDGRAILQAPVDLWVDESSTFFSLSHSALFVVSQTLIAAILWSVYRLTTSRWSSGWWVGPLMLFLAIIHPYDIVPVVAITCVWFAAWSTTSASAGHRRRVAHTLLGWFAWAVPAAIYYYAVPWQQPAVRGWFIQNINLSPTPLAVMLGYGLLWPLAVVGAVVTWHDSRRPTRLLACWVVTVFALLYLPGFSIQRRFISGLHIPFATLAGFGAWFLLQKYRQPIRAVFGIVILSMLSLTTVLRVMTDVQHIVHPTTADYPVNINADDAVSIVWLRQHSSIDDVVLANFWMSNTIAGLAGRPQVFAHPNQTVASWARERDWKSIMDGTTTKVDRDAILDRLHVRWLYWTAADDQRYSYEPENDQRWVMAYQKNSVTIFRYKTTEPTSIVP